MVVNHIPNVLLLGNGILRLADGPKWSDLLEKIAENEISEATLDEIPFSMRPEVLCGTESERVQTKVSDELKKWEQKIPQELEELLTLDFDCILTTNYTYEIENILCNGKWTENRRKKALRCLNDSKSQHKNTHNCYEIERVDKPDIQVWHIHGDQARKRSLVLSYYSYAQSLQKLQEYNAKTGGFHKKRQDEGKAFVMKSWLDWLVCGNVYVVGLGLDFSETDIWWALERKSREKAKVGKTFFYGDKDSDGKKAMLDTMQIQYIPKQDESYKKHYQNIIVDIRGKIQEEK